MEEGAEASSSHESSVDLEMPELEDVAAGATKSRKVSGKSNGDASHKRCQRKQEKNPSTGGFPKDELDSEDDDNDDDEDSKRRRLDGNGQSFRKRSSSAARRYRVREDEANSEPEGSDGEGATAGGEVTRPAVSAETSEDAFQSESAETDIRDMDLSTAVEALQNGDLRPCPTAEAAAGTSDADPAADDEEDVPARGWRRPPTPPLRRRRRRAASTSSSDSDSDNTVAIMEAYRSGNGVAEDIEVDGDNNDDDDDDEAEISGAFLRPWFRRNRGSMTNVDNDPTPEFLSKKPKADTFCLPKELLRRELGPRPGRSAAEFSLQYYSTLDVVRKLRLCEKLEFHRGCVNALGFNSSGRLLASGSDDLKIGVWDWAKKKLLFHYSSGHEANVFQVKFLPLHGDTHIVTSARDGQVRLGELSSAGSCKSTRRLAEHHAPVPKISVSNDDPYVVLSAAEDGMVLETDIREDRPRKLLRVKSETSGERVGLYSVSLNPCHDVEFCVCGCDAVVRIYDRRRIKTAGGPGLVVAPCLRRFVPGAYSSAQDKTHVTSAEYSHDGAEIAASYKDDDVLLFRADDPAEVSDAVHRYEGRRNNTTVKSLAFFGPRSEFVVSGSDCGNLFFWDKETEAVVQFAHGDDGGVVNLMAPHPFCPVMATCGLDHEVKIWTPLAPIRAGSDDDDVSAQVPDFGPALERTVKRNLRERQVDIGMFDGSQSNMLWLLWRHLRRSGEARRRRTELNTRDSSSDSDDSYTRVRRDESEDSDDAGGRPICTTS